VSVLLLSLNSCSVQSQVIAVACPIPGCGRVLVINGTRLLVPGRPVSVTPAAARTLVLYIFLSSTFFSLSWEDVDVPECVQFWVLACFGWKTTVVF
jgi:hypothetical protein